MTNEEHALVRAYETYRDDGHPLWRVRNACRAYHQAMIAATPGLCVHEADGTVRRPTSRDL